MLQTEYRTRIPYTEADKALMWKRRQRDSDENPDSLLRWNFPKGMDLWPIHQNTLNAVARPLNERPWKTLNFETPAKSFNRSIASPG